MRKKGEIKRKYPFLKTIFKDWYNKKLSEIESSKKLDAPPKDFLERLNLSEDEFYDKYILPFDNLSKGELEIVFNLLAPTLVDRYTDLDVSDDCELSLIYDITYPRKKNALDWLLFHVYLLNIFDIHKKVDTPYLQCFYCGKPDSYKRNGIIKNFSNKEKFCHKSKCQKGSNTDRHDNCCYAKWTRKRKTLEKSLATLEDNLYKNAKKNIKDSDLEKIVQEELSKVFIKFCDTQYAENLKINYTMQVLSKRKIDGKYKYDIVKAVNITESNL